VVAPLSAAAITLTAFALSIAPAQAAALLSSALTLAPANNQVQITLTPGAASGDHFAAIPNKADFTFDINSVALKAGVWSTNAGATVITISAIAGIAGATKVTVADAADATNATWATGSSVALTQAIGDITSAVFPMNAANNQATISLTDGTFKAGSMVAADFTFTGNDAASLAAGTFTRTSDTVVTISGLSNLSGINNTVLVKAATLATAVNGSATATVAGSGATFSAVATTQFTVAAANNQTTITLTGGLYADVVSASSFSFTGINAAVLAAGTFTRTSPTVVTIRHASGLVGTNNVVTVLPIAQATQSTSVTAASAEVAVISVDFTMGAGDNAATITLAGGTFKAAPIAAADFTFTGTNAVAFAAGTFTRTSATVVTISGLFNLLTGTTTVDVPIAIMATGAASVVAASARVDTTSNTFTMNAANNQATVVLANGTFKAAPIVAADFTFTGTNAVAFAAGTFTRTTATVVTISGLSNLSGNDNVVVVKAATLAAAASTTATATVSGAGATVNAVATAPFTVAAANNQTTITLTGGVYADVVSSGSFSFTGTNAAVLASGTFTRTSPTMVTIRHASGLLGINNVVTVRPSVQATQSTGATAASAVGDVTSPVFAMGAADNVATITLAGGTFKAGEIVKTDFTFTGTNAEALAAGTFAHTSATVVTISGLSNLAGVNNTVLVKAATMIMGATSVTAASVSPAPIPVPAPSGGGTEVAPVTQVSPVVPIAKVIPVAPAIPAAPVTPVPPVQVNPTSRVVVAPGVIVVSNSVAKATQPRVMKFGPTSKLGIAPKVNAPAVKPINVVASKLTGGTIYTVKLSVKGKYVTLGESTAYANGELQLPVFTVANVGASRIAIINPVDGSTNYIKLVVKK